MVVRDDGALILFSKCCSAAKETLISAIAAKPYLIVSLPCLSSLTDATKLLESSNEFNPQQ